MEPGLIWRVDGEEDLRGFDSVSRGFMEFMRGLDDFEGFSPS